MEQKMATGAINWKISLTRFAAWLLSCLLILVDVFAFHGASQRLLYRWIVSGLPDQADQTITNAIQQATVIDQRIVLALGAVGVIVAILFDRYLHGTDDMKLLLRRAGILFGAQIAFALVCELVQLLIK
jgi:hypothetical protein